MRNEEVNADKDENARPVGGQPPAWPAVSKKSKKRNFSIFK